MSASLEDILLLGDAMLKNQIEPELELPYAESVDWSWTNKILDLGKTPEGSPPSVGRAVASHVGAVPAMPLDLLQMLFRFPKSVMSNQRHVRDRKRNFHSFRCPFCSCGLDAYYIHCPSCRTIFGSLEPRLMESASRKCPRCKTRGFSLTRIYSESPSHLTCRRTKHYTGCRRPLPPDVPWGRHPERHVAVVGITEWKKMAVIGRLWDNMLNTPGPNAAEASGQLTEMECNYLRTNVRAHPKGLRECQDGHIYSVARSATFLMDYPPGKRLMQFHNIPALFLREEEKLQDNGLHMMSNKLLIIVVDVGKKPSSAIADELSMACSRLVRALEFYSGGRKTRNVFPGRVVVVAAQPKGGDNSIDKVRTMFPQLWGLLNTTVSPEQLSCIGGHLDEDGWVTRLGSFVREACQ